MIPWPYLVLLAFLGLCLVVYAIGFVCAARAADVAAAEPISRKPIAKCPVDHCRITGPHSHVEALLRRIREDRKP